MKVRKIVQKKKMINNTGAGVGDVDDEKYISEIIAKIL